MLQVNSYHSLFFASSFIMRLLQVIFGFALFSLSFALYNSRWLLYLNYGELFTVSGDDSIGKFNVLVNTDLVNVTLFDDGRYDLTVPGYDQQVPIEKDIAPENRTLYQFITRGSYSRCMGDASSFGSAQIVPWLYPARYSTHLCTVAFQKFAKVEGWNYDEIPVQRLVDNLVGVFKSRNNTLEPDNHHRDIATINGQVYFTIIDGDRFVDNNIDYLSGLTQYGYFMDAGVPMKASCIKIWTQGNEKGWKVGFGADRSAVETIDCDNQDYSYFEIMTPKKPSPPWIKTALKRVFSIFMRIVFLIWKVIKLLWNARAI